MWINYSVASTEIKSSTLSSTEHPTVHLSLCAAPRVTSWIFLLLPARYIGYIPSKTIRLQISSVQDHPPASQERAWQPLQPCHLKMTSKCSDSHTWNEGRLQKHLNEQKNSLTFIHHENLASAASVLRANAPGKEWRIRNRKGWRAMLFSRIVHLDPVNTSLPTVVYNYF